MGWTSRISLHLLLNCRSLLTMMRTEIIRVTPIHMLTCLWMTRTCRLRVSSLNRILMMVRLSWALAVILHQLLPEAAPLCRYRMEMMMIWIYRSMRTTIMEVIHQEAVPLDRDLAMDLRLMSRPFLWNTMMRLLLLEVLPVLLVQFLSFLIRIRS